MEHGAGHFGPQAGTAASGVHALGIGRTLVHCAVQRFRSWIASSASVVCMF